MMCQLGLTLCRTADNIVPIFPPLLPLLAHGLPVHVLPFVIDGKAHAEMRRDRGYAACLRESRSFTTNSVES